MKQYEIQYRDVYFDDLGKDGEDLWVTWASDTDTADLLCEFVVAVNSEEIDDVNLEWRVKITDETK